MNKQANNFKIRLFSGNVSSGPASPGILEILPLVVGFTIGWLVVL